MPDDATPTFDLAIERAVLTTMLVDPAQITGLADMLDEAHFYDPFHATVFSAILTAYAEGDTGSLLVHRRLLEAGKLTNPDRRRQLSDIAADGPTNAPRRCAEELVTLAGRRKAAQLAARIQAAIHQGTQAETLTNLSEQLTTAVQPAAATVKTMIRLGDLIDGGLTAIERRKDREAAVTTGYTDLDALLGGGLRAGQLVVVAGRPSMGKSTVALDIARRTSISRKLIGAYFTFEMPTLELFDRALSAESGVPYAGIQSGELTDDNWARIGKTVGVMAEAPLFLEADNLAVRQIGNRCRTLAAREGELALIVVDYLQLVPATNRNGHREQEVAEVSRGLKALAIEMNCPVVAVAQLNRKPTERPDKRPQLSDLRESGSIENDADLVIFIHREDYYDKASPRRGEADLIVAKNRSGRLDTITVAAQLHYARFVDMAIPK